MPIAHGRSWISALVALSCAALALSACDGQPLPADAGAGIDSGTGIDSGAPDGGPACRDFTGSYRTAMLLDPCLRGTPIQYGVFCIAQDGCSATLFGTHGGASAVASGDALTFDFDGLLCTARHDGGSLAIECDDPIVMLTCEVRASAAPAVEGTCCVRDAECEAGERCSAITLLATSPIQVVSACVSAGAGALGAECATEAGVDDCGAGLTCTAGGLGDDAIECRTLCRASADCALGETCVWYSLSVPAVGFCMPSCTLFGDECGASGTCDGASAIGTDGSLSDGLACRAVGSLAPRDLCERRNDCPADHTCARGPTGDGAFRCHPSCGPANPCESAADRCVLIGLSDTPPHGACVPR